MNCARRLKRRPAARNVDPADRATLERRFERALDSLWMAFQPIVSWTDRGVHAYEALVRSNEPALGRPLQLLDAAERLRRHHDLGRRIRRKVAESVARWPVGVHCFVNVDCADLDDPELLDARNPLLPFARRSVLEVTERGALHQVGSLRRKVDQLREMGFRLALDDVGAGHAGLPSMARIEPDYVKLDLSLTQAAHRRGAQRRLVRSVARACEETGGQIIAEGVEDESQRDTLLGMGCDLLQGFLFGRPKRVPSAPSLPAARPDARRYA